jgi:ParB-like chromosome segregation protein Spo0J
MENTPKPGTRIELDPNTIIVPEGRLVGRQDQHIDDLADSLGKLGQISPIGVYFNEKGEPVLVYGRHRTEACRQLGRKVTADVLDPSRGQVHMRALEAAENLTRMQLTATQRAEHVKAVLAAHTAELGRDVLDPAQRRWGDREEVTRKIQQATKSSRSTARNLAETASLSEGVLQAVRACPALDSSTFLQTLTQLPSDEARYKRIAAEQRALAGPSRRRAIDPADAARMAAGILQQALTPDERVSLVGLLASTTAKHLAAALSGGGGDE